MKMRPSRVLKLLRDGKTARCLKLNLADPAVVEIAAASGADCVWIDCEHGPNTIRDVERQVLAAHAAGIDTLVRTSKGSYSDLVRPLELDATGIIVPHVMSADEAADIARQTRFAPIGRRALDGGTRDGGYSGIPVEDYLTQANEQRMVIVQIEDPEAIEHLDNIAATPGIDMLFFGPADFTHGLGVIPDFDDPRVEDARRRVAEVARSHGKFAGTVGAVDQLDRLHALGYTFVNSGADVLGLTAYFADIARAAGKHRA